MKTLKDAKIGETVKVVKLTGEGPVQKHVRIRLTTAKIWILRCHSLRNCFKCDILVVV